jgi:hypothetical protein
MHAETAALQYGTSLPAAAKLLGLSSLGCFLYSSRLQYNNIHDW